MCTNTFQAARTFPKWSEYLYSTENLTRKTRLMQPADVDSVIDVHMDGFRGFFLTFLGPSFLREFYTAVCEDPSGIAIVYDDNMISGFVVGTTEPSGFYKRLIQKRWWKFGFASLVPLLKKPSILPRLLRAFTLPAQTAGAQLKTGTLMSLAVSSNSNGKGIGKQLVASFLEASQKRQVEIVNLTTDAIGNESTNEFYKKMGFTLVKVFVTPEGRHMNEYIICL